ncbi:MAG: metallophosphoesterase family protein [Pseudomonadota bacterium]
MKFAILSDIHGNLEAFQAVLKDLSREGLEKIIFLGDIVGYGANPKECIDLLQEKTQAIVAGNHDWAVAGKINTLSFNFVAKVAIEWTITQLSLDYKNFLAQLPLKGREGMFAYTHSTPINPQEWNYIFSPYEAFINLNSLDQTLCFIGHSHIPIVFVLNQSGKLFYTENLTNIVLEESKRFLINIGSVGQPRDSNTLAAYGILDTKKQVFSLRRVHYDIASAQKKIVAAGLPAILAERIGMGW